MPGIVDLLAMDGFGIIGTGGFVVPAALLIVIAAVPAALSGVPPSVSEATGRVV